MPAQARNLLPELVTLGQKAETCTRCGSCMTVCPVYRAGRREELVARGKLNLIRAAAQGDLEPDRTLVQTLSRCLLCGRCSQNCPSEVAADQLIQAGRAALAQRLGAPFVKKLLLEKMLPHPQRLDMAARAGRLARAAVPQSSGLNLRLLEGVEKLPPPASRPFLHQAPRQVNGPKGAPRLALFVGCVGNYLRPELMQKALKLLSRRYTVLIPPDQGCCGLPAAAAGLDQVATQLARRNLASLTACQADLVVTTCGSCLHALVELWPRFLPDQKAGKLAGRAREISQLLAEQPGLTPHPGRPGGPVAVHDPCHLGAGLGITAEPRRVLESAGLDLVEMEGADLCCGGGGMFSLNEPELSQQVFQPRAQAFNQAGAAVLATSCSGCYIQWRRGLNKNIPVLHPIELLAE